MDRVCSFSLALLAVVLFAFKTEGCDPTIVDRIIQKEKISSLPDIADDKYWFFAVSKGNENGADRVSLDCGAVNDNKAVPAQLCGYKPRSQGTGDKQAECTSQVECYFMTFTQKDNCTLNGKGYPNRNVNYNHYVFEGDAEKKISYVCDPSDPKGFSMFTIAVPWDVKTVSDEDSKKALAKIDSICPGHSMTVLKRP